MYALYIHICMLYICIIYTYMYIIYIYIKYTYMYYIYMYYIYICIMYIHICILCIYYILYIYYIYIHIYTSWCVEVRQMVGRYPSKMGSSTAQKQECISMRIYIHIYSYKQWLSFSIPKNMDRLANNNLNPFQSTKICNGKPSPSVQETENQPVHRAH